MKATPGGAFFADAAGLSAVDVRSIARPVRVDSESRAMKTPFTFLVLVGLAASPAVARQFTFDSDAEGWTGVNLNDQPPFGSGGSPLTMEYHANGGNPGGYIALTDPDSLDFWFAAPAGVLGNQATAYGTTLSYDLRNTGNTYDGTPDVVLAGAGIELVINLGPGPTPDVWTPYSVVLNEAAGWRKGSLGGDTPTAGEFQAVLGSLTGLRIRGEYFAGGFGLEVGAIDNVNFAAVPEPMETTVAGGAVLLAFAWWRRR